MPDWFYRTVSRPLLFRLPAVRARDFALGFMGALARLPLGPQVIDFLGHMRADPRLRRMLFGVTFPTPVGLGPRLDARGVALPALARFGVGFLEVGPVTVAPSAGGGPVERRPRDEALHQPGPPPGLGVDELVGRLRRGPKLGVPLLVRLGHAPHTPPEKAAEEGRRLAEGLAPFAAVLSLAALESAVAGGWAEDSWRAYVRALTERLPVVLVLPPALGVERAEPFLRAALEEGAAGVLVDGVVPSESGGQLAGLPAREMALKTVVQLRERFGPALPVVASGGVHEPLHALELRAAGADLVQVDTGLVYTGPGLPKRINEALLYAEARAAPAEAAPEPDRPAERSWFWTALMGAGMLFGSVLALVIAATRVVLHYDEAFVGMTRAELDAVNPRLLAFMAHDRVSLAGTMVA